MVEKVPIKSRVHILPPQGHQKVIYIEKKYVHWKL